MPTRRVLVPLLLIVAACAGEADVAGTTLVADTAPAGTVPRTTTEHPVRTAVASVVEVGSYGFEATVVLTVDNERVESKIDGWVDGNDRELVLQSGDESMLTRVVDGVATVDRGGEVVEIPLQEAGEAPSLTILSDIEYLVQTAERQYQGALTSDALRASGFDKGTAVTITISLTDGGELAGYALESSDGAWSADVTFDDIGGSFS